MHFDGKIKTLEFTSSRDITSDAGLESSKDVDPWYLERSYYN